MSDKLKGWGEVALVAVGVLLFCALTERGHERDKMAEKEVEKSKAAVERVKELGAKAVTKYEGGRDLGEFLVHADAGKAADIRAEWNLFAVTYPKEKLNGYDPTWNKVVSKDGRYVTGGFPHPTFQGGSESVYAGFAVYLADFCGAKSAGLRADGYWDVELDPGVPGGTKLTLRRLVAGSRTHDPAVRVRLLNLVAE